MKYESASFGGRFFISVRLEFYCGNYLFLWKYKALVIAEL